MVAGRVEPPAGKVPARCANNGTVPLLTLGVGGATQVRPARWVPNVRRGTGLGLTRILLQTYSLGFHRRFF